ncbi:PLP-dependent aspartate aminotransferase family protein [Leeia sp. TBRC 13508]|uniref:PLP-dependent aspartate aminotransferase family protein n=1 Tax=Leeia speluncae TaxID=2884804 RepID=A0ABS8DA05_9NEIS|nr:PLP-dependent aspartate aminotransferase family protein [Leeia speluncae]MCB6185035.1 PLP-dependent aspartate aminotransferase family protein [Leeia speluncae]
MPFTSSSLSPETLAVHSQLKPSEPYKDIVSPIYVATTYERAADNRYPGGRVYSRDGNPTYIDIEQCLSKLENGEDALLFASGMAAATSVFQALQPESTVLAPKHMYWALRKWLIQFTQQWKIHLHFYENGNSDEIITLLSQHQVDLIWIETPANPTWELTDVAAITKSAKQKGTRIAVDATVMTPVLAKPLDWRADLVMHSATKYLNGHSDVIAGALVTKVVSPFWQRIREIRALGGSVLGPFEAWLLQRGLKTLFLRVKTASANALELAYYLEQHPQILSVSYPGLSSFPQHELAKTQFTNGFGGMLSIRIKGGAQQAIAVAAGLQVFKRATSLGSVESLVEHRKSVEGEGSACPDDLLRLSIGIENIHDLIQDFRQALDQLEK